jgi:hypothetical protein
MRWRGGRRTDDEIGLFGEPGLEFLVRARKDV